MYPCTYAMSAIAVARGDFGRRSPLSVVRVGLSSCAHVERYSMTLSLGRRISNVYHNRIFESSSFRGNSMNRLFSLLQARDNFRIHFGRRRSLFSRLLVVENNSFRTRASSLFSSLTSTLLTEGPRKRKRDAPLPFYDAASVTSPVSPLSCSHYQ